MTGDLALGKSRRRREPSTNASRHSGNGLRRLFEPVDIAALVYYRIAFGALMLWNVWFYYKRGFIAAFWIEPTFFFSFPGFGWIHPWPGDGMYHHFAALAVLAVLIAAGCFHRMSAALFWAGLTYVFLLDQTNYRNHFYLLCLTSFLRIFVPAHRAFDRRMAPAVARLGDRARLVVVDPAGADRRRLLVRRVGQAESRLRLVDRYGGLTAPLRLRMAQSQPHGMYWLGSRIKVPRPWKT